MSKKYLIKIDKRTIKKNPDAGSRQTVISKGATYEASLQVFYMSGDKWLVDLLNKFEGVSVDLGVYEGQFVCMRFILLDYPKNFKRFTKNKKFRPDRFLKYLLGQGAQLLSVGSSDNLGGTTFSIDCDNHLETVRHGAIPDYTYKYLDSKVVCEECSSSFSHTRLEEDCNEYPIYNICPVCGISECCEIEYEDIK